VKIVALRRHSSALVEHALFDPVVLPALQDDVLALHMSVFAQPLLERLDEMRGGGGSAWDENANAGDFRRLRDGRERRMSEANSENNREPDQPHGHLGGGWLAGSLAERHDAHQHGAARADAQGTQARQMLRKLLHEPMAVTPFLVGTRRGFRFEGHPVLDRLVSGEVANSMSAFSTRG
jgi:hypothetical protein